jgi:hypothetical protein
VRHKLVSKLPITSESLRGTLLECTVRRTIDCPKCARGEGHQVFVLTVGYPGRREWPLRLMLSKTESGDARSKFGPRLVVQRYPQVVRRAEARTAG